MEYAEYAPDTNLNVGTIIGGRSSSKVKLALEYQRPVIAYLDSASEIPDLPEDVLVESDLEGVADFVLKHVAK